MSFLKKILKRPGFHMYLAGARDLLPILLSSFPFGIIVGASSYAAGFKGTMVVVYALLVYAGAAQLAIMQLMGENTPIAVVILSGLVINLRFLLYSASTSVFFRHFGFAMRFLIAFVLTDQSYGVLMMRRAKVRGGSGKKFMAQPILLQAIYYLGASLTFYFSWQVAFFIGYRYGGVFLQGVSIDYVVPLTFLSMLLATVVGKKNGMILVALLSGSVALLAYRLPLNLGFLVAVSAGLLLAAWFTKKQMMLEDKQTS